MWNDPGSGTAERRFENVFEAVPDFYVVDNDGFRLKHKKDGKDFTKETYLFRILIKIETQKSRERFFHAMHVMDL
ncbi:hypothetical protein D3Z62_28070 [Lachnospiraceae bacterium]|nr:hypothetical protein [Lachnospiraceae bacterium]